MAVSRPKSWTDDLTDEQWRALYPDPEPWQAWPGRGVLTPRDVYVATPMPYAISKVERNR